KPGFSRREVLEWIRFVKQKGVKRVCCLLSPDQLRDFEDNLTATYAKHFGDEMVCMAPITDYHLVDRDTFENKILPFLKEAERDKAPIVVHCWSGKGRTGHILAAWLVRVRGLSPDQAISAVVAMGRKPCEA